MNCTALVIGKHCVIVVMLQGFERASSKDRRSPAGSFEVTLLLAFPWTKPARGVVVFGADIPSFLSASGDRSWCPLGVIRVDFGMSASCPVWGVISEMPMSGSAG
jgi:hypothetical protein